MKDLQVTLVQNTCKLSDPNDTLSQWIFLNALTLVHIDSLSTQLCLE